MKSVEGKVREKVLKKKNNNAETHTIVTFFKLPQILTRSVILTNF